MKWRSTLCAYLNYFINKLTYVLCVCYMALDIFRILTLNWVYLLDTYPIAIPYEQCIEDMGMKLGCLYAKILHTIFPYSTHTERSYKLRYQILLRKIAYINRKLTIHQAISLPFDHQLHQHVEVIIMKMFFLFYFYKGERAHKTGAPFLFVKYFEYFAYFARIIKIVLAHS